jgi:hypothetical protein
VLLRALVVAAAVSVLLALVQVFKPDWTDNRWIAPLRTAGRAAGNLRQPNQLAMLLMLGLVAWMVLRSPRADIQDRIGWALAAALGFGIALTGSRTGLLGLGVIAVWCLVDRSLLKAVRWQGAAAVAGCVMAMLLLWSWAPSTSKRKPRLKPKAEVICPVRASAFGPTPCS